MSWVFDYQVFWWVLLVWMTLVFISTTASLFADKHPLIKEFSLVGLFFVEGSASLLVFWAMLNFVVNYGS